MNGWNGRIRYIYVYERMERTHTIYIATHSSMYVLCALTYHAPTKARLTLLVDGVVDGEDDGHVALLRIEALGLWGRGEWKEIRIRG